MTREQLKDAVVEAARNVANAPNFHGILADALRHKLDALDAHTEAEAPEVVTLAVMEDKEDGEFRYYRLNGSGERWMACEDWTRLGTTQITITREGGQ